MNSITEKAQAKINLYLDVTGKRADGYHTVKSVMHSVDYFDIVTVSENTAGDVSMTCNEKTLSCGEDNLCIRAANLFFNTSGIHGGCLIELEKTIPMQAGLGGGSSDAAAVMRGLNRIYGEPLTVSQLREISVKLGADVPFCITGGSSLAQGIGEELSSYPSLPHCYIVISRGIGSVSTPEAYRMIDTVPPSRAGDFSAFDSAMRSGDICKIASNMYNRFEDTLPSCMAVKDIFMKNGSLGSLLSGSGSAVFGLFDKSESAEKAVHELVIAGYGGVKVEVK